MLTLLVSQVGAQCFVHPKPQTIFLPRLKVTVDGAPFRIIIGQKPPLTARKEKIKNGINDLSKINFTRSAGRFRHGKQIFDMIPLTIS